MAATERGETLQAEGRDTSVEQSVGRGDGDGGHGTCPKGLPVERSVSARDVSSPPCQGPSQASSLAEGLPLEHLEKGIGHVEERDQQAAEEVHPETQDGSPEEKTMLWNRLQKLKLDLQEEMRKLQDEERLNAEKLEETVQRQRDRVAREFETLHQYLEEEKSRFLSRLEQEKEEVLLMSLEKVTQLEERNASLTKLLAEIEEKSLDPSTGQRQEWQKATRRFTSFRAIKERLCSKEQAKILQCFNQESTDIQKDIIESLEWRHARHFSDGVVLDSASAHPKLSLSEDQQSVKMGHSHQSVPDSPERFAGPCVLGLQRFTSGDHYWEVKVEGTREWILGACYESVSRKAPFGPSPESGYWAVGLWDGYRALKTAYPGTTLKPRVRPKAVGMFLNYDTGRITLYNAGDRSQLYTFPPTQFREPLCPVLCMWDTVTALQILPVTGGH